MKRLMLQVLCLLMILLMLCACGASQEPSEEPQTTETVSYTVTFMLGRTVYESQQVTEFRCPAPVTPEVAGLEFCGWLDENGEPVQPETEEVLHDVRYFASVKPLLDLHMPYLQLDENNMLHPEDPLTGEMLLYALQQLSRETVHPFLPELPPANEVTAIDLRLQLEIFFPQEEIGAVITAEDDEILTRAMFAAYMHRLLGRQEQETLILGTSAVLPADITAQRDDAYILMEASMRHSPDPAGQSWADFELPTGWEPGLQMREGWLYYVQEDGRLLRDGDLGKLHFGSDGRYTSGDPELDTLVAEKLKTIVEENPELEGLDLLRKVYDHCHQDYKYVRKDAYGLGATGWEVEDAKEMLQKGKGNCYNFAAAFWALAQGMGYDVQCLAGTCTGTDQPHGWVVLKHEGVSYFVDPEWQYAYTEREVFDHDMFMLTMDEIWYWTYRWDTTQFSA